MTTTSLPSEQTVNIVGNNSGVHGHGQRGTFSNRPVNVVAPMVVQSPEKEAIDERDGPVMQETMSPKNTLMLEDLTLKDLLPEGSKPAFKIAQMLNRDNNRIIRNWRHLAESLGVPGDVCLSFICDQEHSPTEDLFEYLETWKPKTTIGDLKKSLRSMSRNDLVQFLESKGILNNSKIQSVCDHPEIVDTFKEKLDIQSRTLSWTQLAIKCGIPKKTFSKFGKPKLGPTSQLFLHIRLSDNFEKLSVGELKKHIKDMDRFDVVRVLQQNEVKDDALVKDVFKVDTQILDETSELLDKDLRSTKNWRSLAVKLGIPNHTYEDFDTAKGSNKNPTMLLLNWLAISQSNLKAVEFIKHLKTIQRNDVVEELQKEMPSALERRIKFENAMDEQSVATGEGSFFQGSEVVPYCSCLNHSVDFSSLSIEHPHDLLVTQLPLEIYSKVCARLDAEDPFFRDYRMLAESLGVSNEQIQILGQKKSKPTHSLLIDNKLRIKQFLEILKKIEREDVMEIIETWLDQKSFHDSENTDQSDSALVD